MRGGTGAKPWCQPRRELLAFDRHVTAAARRPPPKQANRIIRFQSEDSARSLNICLAETHCRWYALFTLRSWATVQHTVTRITRDAAGGRVELHYSGIDGTGMSGRGSVVFVREAGEWKIGAESFGPEGSIRKAAGPAIRSAEAF